MSSIIKIHNNNLSALEFCIGAVIDEAQVHSYIDRSSCSRARTLLVIQWMVVGFFLTICYKSVLRAMMIRIDYEKTIDTIDDMIQSDIPIMMCSDTHMPILLKNDPREKVKALAEKVDFYLSVGGNKNPDWIEKG